MWKLMNKETSKQNIIRDIEIKNKLAVTRGYGEEGKWGKTSEVSSQGTCIKDRWTKPEAVRFQGGRRG